MNEENKVLTPENITGFLVAHLDHNALIFLRDQIREYGEQQRLIKQQDKESFFYKWEGCIPREISLDDSCDFQVVNGPEQFKKELNDL